jgi:hypothetical protein
MVGEVEYNEATVEESTVHPIRVHPYIQSSQQSSSNPFATSIDGPNIVAGYQEGVGLNRTFLEYIWDGATASAIGDECISVYKFIVENYTDEHEIWLFGFSRGAFTVRCVTGMINNYASMYLGHTVRPYPRTNLTVTNASTSKAM